MGEIMTVGVAVADATLLVTFAERSRKEGASASDAALTGVRSRIRATPKVRNTKGPRHRGIMEDYSDCAFHFLMIT
jgi:hypothetical protein